MGIEAALLARAAELDRVGLGCGPVCPCRSQLAQEITQDLDGAISALPSMPRLGAELALVGLLGSGATDRQAAVIARMAARKTSDGCRLDERRGSELDALRGFYELALHQLLATLKNVPRVVLYGP